MIVEFGAGVGLGLTVAAPIGPMAVLCIGRTLYAGPQAGIATGLGAASVHCLFGSAAALGLGVSAPSLSESGARYLSIASAFILLGFAIRLVLRKPHPIGGPAMSAGRTSSLYTSAFLLGLTNPATFLLFASALPTIVRFGGSDAVPALAAGIFAGSVVWWICLSFMVGMLRLTLGDGIGAMMNKLSGAALSAFGLWLLLRAL